MKRWEDMPQALKDALCIACEATTGPAQTPESCAEVYAFGGKRFEDDCCEGCYELWKMLGRPDGKARWGPILERLEASKSPRDGHTKPGELAKERAHDPSSGEVDEGAPIVHRVEDDLVGPPSSAEIDGQRSLGFHVKETKPGTPPTVRTELEPPRHSDFQQVRVYNTAALYEHQPTRLVFELDPAGRPKRLEANGHTFAVLEDTNQAHVVATPDDLRGSFERTRSWKAEHRQPVKLPTYLKAALEAAVNSRAGRDLGGHRAKANVSDLMRIGGELVAAALLGIDPAELRTKFGT